MNRNLTRVTSGLALITAITLCAPGIYAPVFADNTVDPSTLTPPPPAEFNPVCKAVGDSTICDVSFTEPPKAEPTGIQCGSGADAFEIAVNSVRSVEGKRFYDQNNKLTRRHAHDLIVGTFTNPLTGAHLLFSQHDTIRHDLAVPGDITSGTEADTTEFRVTTPDGGTVLIDAGRSVWTEFDGPPLFEAGQHHFTDFFIFGQASAVQPMCDALA